MNKRDKAPFKMTEWRELSQNRALSPIIQIHYQLGKYQGRRKKNNR